VRTVVGLAMATLMAAAASYAFAPRQTAALAPSTLPVGHMNIDSLARSSAGLVAAGELGTIVVSRDDGRHWTPAAVNESRQALITQVVFAADGRHGLAVGHEGWILRTTDGGLSWKEAHFDTANGAPLMSVATLSPGLWVAVGAFGRALRSDDDGATWRPLDLAAAGVEDKHLNRIAGSADGRHWLIVGERGLVLAGDARGLQWRPVEPFYKGSLYGAVALGGDAWVVYGMRGNVFRSTDDGATWTRSDVPAPISFFGHAIAPDGRLLLVGQGGTVASSSDGGAHFTLVRPGRRATLTDLSLAPDGTGWLASDAGLTAYPPAASLPTAGASR
jgi:photosystem II stability/assembly factor-like uncharacterized protein